jgi:hypothetical protein
VVHVSGSAASDNLKCVRPHSPEKDYPDPQPTSSIRTRTAQPCLPAPAQRTSYTMAPTLDVQMDLSISRTATAGVFDDFKLLTNRYRRDAECIQNVCFSFPRTKVEVHINQDKVEVVYVLPSKSRIPSPSLPSLHTQRSAPALIREAVIVHHHKIYMQSSLLLGHSTIA